MWQQNRRIWVYNYPRMPNRYTKKKTLKTVLRSEPEQRAAWDKRARSEGRTVSEWLRDLADAEVKRPARRNASKTKDMQLDW